MVGEGAEGSSRRAVLTDGTTASQQPLPGAGRGDDSQAWGENFRSAIVLESGHADWGEDDDSEIGLKNRQRQDRPATGQSKEPRRETPNGGLLLLSSASSSDRKGGGSCGAPCRAMTASSGTEGNCAPSRAATASSGTGSVTRVSTAATRETTREAGRTTPSTGSAAAGDSGSCYGRWGWGAEVTYVFSG